MKSKLHRNAVGFIMLSIILALLALGACTNSNDEVIDLLKDEKVGLSHLNDEFHTIKGEDLLANPKFGLAHLNEELHTIRVAATDPKIGFAHLNDEFHIIKEMLAELAQQLESLQQKVESLQ